MIFRHKQPVSLFIPCHEASFSISGQNPADLAPEIKKWLYLSVFFGHFATEDGFR